MIRKYKGFTLIELLVVIAIIGILASIVLVSLTAARTRAYDAEIKSELAQLRSAAELHYMDEGTYAGFDTNSAYNSLVTPGCSAMANNDYGWRDNNDYYAAWSSLCSGDNYWCVDSGGFAGEIGNTAPTAQVCQ